MNTVIISGNLTRDPETQATNGEWGIVKFSIANNDRSRKNAEGGYDKVPQFFDVQYWTKDPARLLQNLYKGDPVVIQGQLVQDRWEKDGQQHSRVMIEANNPRNGGFGINKMWSPKQEGAAAPQSEPAAAPQSEPAAAVDGFPPLDDSDIPF